MTCTLPRLRELLDGEGLRYYLIPDQEGVMLTLTGTENRYQFRILLEDDGNFLQFRSDGYLLCPQGHPNLDTVLKVMGAANYRLRLMKFGWDPTDGEIAAYVDQWVMDADFTQAQFGRMADAYMAILDDEYTTFKAAIDSGVGVDSPPDPDEPDQETIDTL
jgi:hypothetical protein